MFTIATAIQHLLKQQYPAMMDIKRKWNFPWPWRKHCEKHMQLLSGRSSLHEKETIRFWFCLECGAYFRRL